MKIIIYVDYIYICAHIININWIAGNIDILLKANKKIRFQWPDNTCLNTHLAHRRC